MKVFWNILNILIGCCLILFQSQFTFPILAEIFQLTEDSLGLEILVVLAVGMFAVPYCIIFFIITLFFKKPRFNKIKTSSILILTYLVLALIFIICAMIR